MRGDEGVEEERISMKWKQYRIPLGLGLLAVLVATWFALGQRQKSSSRAVIDERRSELPPIDVAKLTEVSIARPGETTITVVKTGDYWLMTEPLASEVDRGTVDNALERLGSLEISGIAATQPTSHDALEVSAERGISVIAKTDAETVAHLYIGSYKAGATMLRRKGEDTVLAAKGSIAYAFDKDVSDFRNKQVTDIDTAQVVKARFVSDTGVYTFHNVAEKTWERDAKEKRIAKLSSLNVRLFVQNMARMRASGFAAADIDREAAGISDASPTVTLSYVPKLSDAAVEGEASTEDEVAEDDDAATAKDEPEKPRFDPDQIVELVLRLGNETAPDSGNFYVVREGDPVIYTLAAYTAERFRPTPDKLVEQELTAPKVPENAAAPVDTSDLDPAVIEQIRRQMAGSGGMGSPH